jgi:hypothetical protein
MLAVVLIEAPPDDMKLNDLVRFLVVCMVADHPTRQSTPLHFASVASMAKTALLDPGQ